MILLLFALIWIWLIIDMINAPEVDENENPKPRKVYTQEILNV